MPLGGGIHRISSSLIATHWQIVKEAKQLSFEIIFISVRFTGVTKLALSDELCMLDVYSLDYLMCSHSFGQSQQQRT